MKRSILFSSNALESLLLVFRLARFIGIAFIFAFYLIALHHKLPACSLLPLAGGHRLALFSVLVGRTIVYIFICPIVLAGQPH